MHEATGRDDCLPTEDTVLRQRLRASKRRHGAADAQATRLDVRALTGLETHLRHAQKMEALGAFASGIAHDFNNILTAIVGYAQLASQTLAADEPGQRHLCEILTASNRAQALIGQILLFGRPGADDRQYLRLPQVINEVLALLRASLPASIGVAYTQTTEASAVLADATQMHQVLLNLCENAAHAMRDTGGVIDIRLDAVQVEAAFAAQRPPLRSGTHLRVSVRDRGPGIPATMLARIFDPFFTTKKRGEGTGLGLAIAQSVMANHGGAITVESAPGAGATFKLYLPQLGA